jgi:PKD repeat protein
MIKTDAMKKILLITGLIVTIFSSCVREPIYDPFASFSVDYSLVLPNEVVNFTNYSTDAESFQWDFGDGTFSSDVNPSHYYSHEGTFTVKLTAINHNQYDYATVTIEVQETTLEVDAVEYYSGDVIPNATVTLYTNYNDWYNINEDNAVASGVTDNYGVVIFKGLQTVPYYIDVYSTIANNSDIGLEDINFVKTLSLEYASYNTFTAYCDYSTIALLKSAGSKRMRAPLTTETKRSFSVKPPYMNKK